VTSWGLIFFQVNQALFNHLSVQFSDVDFQEISGKHPENSGNLLSQAGFFPPEIYFFRLVFYPEIYFLRLVFISRKFPCLIGCGLASALLVTEIS
jgi:hypothetical protein